MQTKLTWDELDGQDQEDLLAWFNVREPGAEDKERLAKLLADGLFEAWDCPECGERVYRGEPKDWGHFQGVLQVDYTSYPGNTEKYNEEYLLKMCDHCRCYK